MAIIRTKIIGYMFISWAIRTASMPSHDTISCFAKLLPDCKSNHRQTISCFSIYTFDISLVWKKNFQNRFSVQHSEEFDIDSLNRSLLKVVIGNIQLCIAMICLCAIFTCGWRNTVSGKCSTEFSSPDKN